MQKMKTRRIGAFFLCSWGVCLIGQLKFFENLVNQKLLSLHTAYIGKVLSTDGITAKIQPLGKTKQIGGEEKTQSPIPNVPILNSARWKYTKRTLRYVSGVSDHAAQYSTVDIVVPRDIAAGDIVLCVCCERDITAAKKGSNVVPPVGHHDMSASVVVGIL